MEQNSSKKKYVMTILIKSKKIKLIKINWQAFLTKKKCFETKTRCITYITFFKINNITVVTFNIIAIIILITIIYSLMFLIYLQQNQPGERKGFQL